MAIVAATGVGSGVDIEGLVTGLIDAEAAPAKLQFDRREAELQSKISAVGTLKSAMSSFRDAIFNLNSSADFNKKSAVSADSSVFTASAGTAAVAGSYAIEVDAIATKHKLSSAGVADAAATAVGTGTLTIASGAESFDIIVGAGSNTLNDIRDAINNSADNSTVSASIITVDDPNPLAPPGTTIDRLILTARNEGASNAIAVSVLDNDGDNADAAGLSSLASANLNELTTAVDASIKIDGATLTSSSNTITNAISGVSLNLQTAAPGTRINLDISEDKTSVKTNVEKFVEAFNTLQSTMANLSSYDKETGDTGALFGDAALRTIQSRVRRELSETVESVTGSYNTLSSLGITTQEDGSLKIDTDKLNSALESDFSSVSQLFTADDGVGKSYESLMSAYIGADGILTSREASINNRLDNLNDEKVKLDARLDQREAYYRSQFIAMDALVGSMRATGDYLTQQLANLPGVVRDTSK